MKPRHSFQEHTSEVRLRVEAETIEELFEESGRALAELIAEPSAGASRGPEKHIELHARDQDALLIEWLNELVFRAETEKLVYDQLKVSRIEGGNLAATLRGHEPKGSRASVKAATMHDVRIERTNEGLSASFILDV
jgi:SHS2 domain-containing protein